MWMIFSKKIFLPFALLSMLIISTVYAEIHDDVSKAFMPGKNEADKGDYPSEGEKDSFVPVEHSEETADSIKESILLCHQVLQSVSNLEDAYINLGIFLSGKGEYLKAIAPLISALHIQPASLPVLNKLGAAFIMIDDYGMACDVLKEAIVIEPSNPSAHFSLGIAYLLKGDKISAYREYLILRDLDAKLADNLFEIIN
jgi:tetratricopeptide (TPR) repeat protein